MSFNIQNNPLLSFKLIGGKLFILCDTDFNDKSRKPKISIVNGYKNIHSFSMELDGYDSIEEVGSVKTISGVAKLKLKFSDGKDLEVLLANQTIPLVQNSKFKRNKNVSLDKSSVEFKKQIFNEWNEVFEEALTSLYELERSQLVPGPTLLSAQGGIGHVSPIPHSYISKKQSNPLMVLATNALQSGLSKVFIAFLLIFALIQMFIALSGNAIDVKNKKMEGEVFSSIANGSGEDEAVKRVLKEMGIERNTDKNDLGCFVE